MQEYAELYLAPSRINRQTVFRHSAESIWLRARIVNIPALEYVTGWRVRRFVIIIRSNSVSVWNTGFGMDLPLAILRHDAISIAIIIRTIHEV